MWLSAGLALSVFAAPAMAQDSASARAPAYDPPIPARAFLSFRAELELSDAQVAKLKTLETTQVVALTKATAAFLRAEADLLDIKRDDLAAYRVALEKRAKVAIDAEVIRLQAEKDSRAVLTADQRTKAGAIDGLQSLRTTNDVTVWQSVVAPPPVTRMVNRGIVPDSTEVRISVTPTYADIYLDGVKIGSGRRFVSLPVGGHTLLYHAEGCTDIVLPISVAKGPPMVVPPQKLTCSKLLSP